jgi:hypothetical protein
MPVLICHGNTDEEIHHGRLIKLKGDFKPDNRLIILENESHRSISDNAIYQKELKKTFGKIKNESTTQYIKKCWL